MEKPVSLRLGEFGKITGENPQTVNHLIYRGRAPINCERLGPGKREFGLADLLSWCLFVQLRNMGLSAEAAGDAVRLTLAAEEFLNCIVPEPGKHFEDPRDLHLYVLPVEHLDPVRGVMRVLGEYVGTPAAISEQLARECDRLGEINPDNGREHLGATGLVAVPIFPCWKRVCATLEAHGFTVKGRSIFEAEA